MTRSEEIIFAVKTISPKKGDIVVISGDCIDKRTKHELGDYFLKMGLMGVLAIGKIDDISLADESELKEMGLMRIPEKETNGS